MIRGHGDRTEDFRLINVLFFEQKKTGNEDLARQGSSLEPYIPTSPST